MNRNVLKCGQFPNNEILTFCPEAGRAYELQIKKSNSGERFWYWIVDRSADEVGCGKKAR